jgi:hypothetical protein
VRNELTEAVNPLKLLEYYSLGIPVLATRLPELEGVGGPIRLAADDAEFVAELRGILEHGPRGRDEAAIAIARQSTWAHRAEQLSSFIGTLAPRPRTALGNPRGEP